MDSSSKVPGPQSGRARGSVSDAAFDVSVIIPARNEEQNLGACLHSLMSQTGVTFEIIVVDDSSTDSTRSIAQEFGVQVIAGGTLPRDSAGNSWTGKNNALTVGSRAAKGEWLLFTDADTVHLPGALGTALKEAKRERADLLSYSPAQEVVTFAERAVMPVVFAELAAQYPPEKVGNPKSEVVAANGQYILVRREVYEAVGGHGAVATKILEDVALAERFRDEGHRIHFRYGGDVVRARMYRNWAQLREGWTKNLAFLFPKPKWLALRVLLFWLAAWFSIRIAISGVLTRHFPLIGAVAVWILIYRRIVAANFNTLNNIIAIAFGLPLFSYLLLRSSRAHARGDVEWKGRSYEVMLKEQDLPGAMLVEKTRD